MVSNYERSEGEVGSIIAPADLSLGEVKLAKNAGRSITPNDVQRPRYQELSETYNYEENRALVGETEIEKPVYDSSDGPLPSGKRNQANGRGKADVFVSGDSFGGKGKKAFVAGAASRAVANNSKRERIGEDFLDDDKAALVESGEIDPRLFQ